MAQVVLLQSHEKYAELATLDLITGKIQFYSKDDHPEMAAVPIKGHYSLISGKILCFYKYENKLFFRMDEKIIELDDNTHINIFKKAKYEIFQRFKIFQKYRVFQIIKNNGIIFSLEYLPEKWELPLEFDMVEEEHFDFCLFVYNVVNNPGRRARIYTR